MTQPPSLASLSRKRVWTSASSESDDDDAASPRAAAAALAALGNGSMPAEQLQRPIAGEHHERPLHIRKHPKMMHIPLLPIAAAAATTSALASSLASLHLPPTASPPPSPTPLQLAGQRRRKRDSSELQLDAGSRQPNSGKRRLTAPTPTAATPLAPLGAAPPSPVLPPLALPVSESNALLHALHEERLQRKMNAGSLSSSRPPALQLKQRPSPPSQPAFSRSASAGASEAASSSAAVTAGFELYSRLPANAFNGESSWASAQSSWRSGASHKPVPVSASHPMMADSGTKEEAVQSVEPLHRSLSNEEMKEN